MKSTFRILFLVRWELKKENGKVLINARITLDGEKVQFSLKTEVSTSIWDPKAERVIGQTQEALQLNRYLDSIKGQIISSYHRLSESNEVVTATMIKDAFLGYDVKNNTLLTVFEEFNDRQGQLIGIDITQSTFNKYDLTYRRLKEFLKVKLRKSDIMLNQVDRNFVMDFEAYLKTEYRLNTNSSEKLMRIFKRITTMSFKSGLMTKDPFCDYKLKKVKKDRGYLTKSELERILEFTPDSKRLEKVRDIFLFYCSNGSAWHKSNERKNKWSLLLVIIYQQYPKRLQKTRGAVFTGSSSLHQKLTLKKITLYERLPRGNDAGNRDPHRFVLPLASEGRRLSCHMKPHCCPSPP